MENYTFALRESSFKCTGFRAHKPTIYAYICLRCTIYMYISHSSVSVLVCAMFTWPLLHSATFTFFVQQPSLNWNPLVFEYVRIKLLR